MGGQLGVNYISMLGNIVLGNQYTQNEDPDNPIWYPVSCGPGSQGGSIVGTVTKHRQKQDHKWPTK